MSSSSAKITIGEVYTSRPGYASDQVADALRELTGFETDRTEIPGLAGPNELIQILADLEGWKQIGLALVAYYGAGWMKEVASSHYKKIVPLVGKAPAALLKLVKGLGQENAAGNTVSIGLIEPTLDFQARTDRLILEEFEPNDVARKLMIFANCAKPLSEWLHEEKAAGKAEGRNPQLSVRITAESTLVAEIQTNPHEPAAGMTKKRIFGVEGELISESISKP